MQKKGYVEMEKVFFFQWHSGNNIKIANPAKFKSPDPSATWNSELCYFFHDFWGSRLMHELIKCS